MKRYLILLILAFLFSEVKAEESDSELMKFETDAPIYVVGDVHGAYESILKTLQTMNLVNKEKEWIGGESHFVSLGDLMDRGPSSRKIMDLYMSLQQQAASAGGRFHVVLGNHEVMNLTGDLRYLSEQEIAEFADDESTEMRDKAYQVHLSASRLSEDDYSRELFDKKYARGFFARQQAFSLDGKYGQWLRKLPFILQINDQMFTHGGLSTQIADGNLEEVNTRLKDMLVQYAQNWQSLILEQQLSPTIGFHKTGDMLDTLPKSLIKKELIEAKTSLVFSKQSPTWYRGNALCHPYFEQDNLIATLAHFDATRLWVGHTTNQSKKPLSRLNGHLMLMDTGMLSSHYRGEPWVAKFSRTSPAKYYNGLTAKEIQPAVAANREWANPFNLTDAEVEDFMTTAKITKTGTTKEGKTKPFRVDMEKDGKLIKGIFKYKDTVPRAHVGTWLSDGDYADRYQFEVAAYKLDRMLNIGLVPVTVERVVDGKAGIIQLWIDNLTSDLILKDEKIRYYGYCDEQAQINFIDSFDYIIANRDRNQSNMLYSADDLQIWFIDHSRSFWARTKRPKLMRKLKIEPTDAFVEALKTLDYENLQALRPWLHNKQIKSLLKRRDRFIKNRF